MGASGSKTVDFDGWDDDEEDEKKKKKKSKKGQTGEEGEVARAARILATIEHLDTVRIAADELLRREERKDSIYELDMSVQRNTDAFRQDVLNKLEDQFMVNGRVLRTKEAKEASKKHAGLFKKAVCTAEELRRLQTAVLAMETYKRLNAKLREELEVLEVKRNRRKEKFEEIRKQLKNDLDEAERGFWCREQIKVWEPERDPQNEAHLKVLALEGGPRSPHRMLDRSPASPTVRLLSSKTAFEFDGALYPRHDDPVVEELKAAVGIRERDRVEEL